MVQWDVNTTFLYDNITEDIYMEQPEGLSPRVGKMKFAILKIQSTASNRHQEYGVKDSVVSYISTTLHQARQTRTYSSVTKRTKRRTLLSGKRRHYRQ
jgi:hypothetical protein